MSIGASAVVDRDPGPLRDRGRRALAPLPVSVTSKSIATLVIFSLGTVLVLGLAYVTRSLLVELLVAAIVAMALEPPVSRLERRGLSRVHSVGVTFLLSAAIVVVFLYALLPPLAAELARFVRDIPSLLEQLGHGDGPVASVAQRYHIVEWAQAWIAQHTSADTIGPSALRIATEFLKSGAAVAAIAFFALFLSLDGPGWFDAFIDTVPDEKREPWRRVGSGVSASVGGYVFGNLLISLIAGTVATLVLVATHVPHPVPLGLIVAALDLIPIVGATIGTIIVAAFAMTRGVAVTAIVVASMWLYQEVENHVLIQAVYHRTVNLSPLAIAVSVAAGAEIGGIPGALLAIPVVGAIKVAATELIPQWHGGGAS